MVASYVAVDLGAASGRVMVGQVGADRLELVEAHRFANRPVRLPSGLHWDILALYREALDGLRAAGRLTGSGPASIGVDSWAVDYGLLDENGALLGNPYHYRDSRTDGMMRRALSTVPAGEIYAVTGLQFLPFNTVYQLLADAPGQLAAARTLLLIPDLLSYWLTGQIAAEATNASTTGLYDVSSRSWATGLIHKLGLPERIFPPLRQPGEPAGPLLPAVREETGLAAQVPVTAVGSHDTASAVVAVPAATDRFAYISCGTWALVGLELPAPVRSEQSRLANFTNEGGVFGTIRYLRNVMGLWLLQESMRSWQSASSSASSATHSVRGASSAAAASSSSSSFSVSSAFSSAVSSAVSASSSSLELPALLAAAAAEPAFAAVIDPDDPSFLPPGDMPARIAEQCRRTGQPPPVSPPAVVRCILDSLALAFRTTLRDAQRLSGRDVEVVHLVGGGAQNELLCQLTADACGLAVVAGPVEATALGNLLVQAQAHGEVADLAGIRALVAATQPVRRYQPRGSQRSWDAAASRVYDHQ